MGHPAHPAHLCAIINHQALLTVKEELQLAVEELLLGPGGGEAGGVAQSDRVDEPHAVELDLLPAALPAKDSAAAAAVVLQKVVP